MSVFLVRTVNLELSDILSYGFLNYFLSLFMQLSGLSQLTFLCNHHKRSGLKQQSFDSFMILWVSTLDSVLQGRVSFPGSVGYVHAYLPPARADDLTHMSGSWQAQWR